MNTATSYAQRNARVSRPERTQVEYFFKSIDQLVPRDHRCRLVWRFVQSLDLERFYCEIIVSDSQAGRSAIAPEVLIALWLMATLDAIGSARKLERCCDTDLIYRWICGGVSVNHHTLSDFRVFHGEKLNEILTSSVASLIHQGFVSLEEIGQDGMRVRAAAGSSSFRRQPTLETLHDEAKKHLEELDGGQLVPMLAQIEERYDRRPEAALVDSAYATKESVRIAESHGTIVISTVPRSDQLRKHGKDPHQRQKGDSDQYEAFRQRMALPENQERYKKRPSIAEFPNADCRNRGLTQFRVRGLLKTKAVVLWHVLAFNLLRMANLGAIS